MLMFSITHLRDLHHDNDEMITFVTYGHEHMLTTHQPGCDLPRCSWSLMNRFRTGHSACQASLYKWGLTVTELLVW